MGEQVHINHVGCESGEDTKRRLYIKRVDKGLLAYCHHCNDKAFVKDHTHHSWFATGSSSEPKKVAALKLTDEISFKAKAWLMNYSCTPSYESFKGVVGNENKLALTLHDSNGVVCGHQIRNLLPDAKPKYISRFYNSNTDVAWFNNGCKTLVITEDYLSAYRVHRDAGFTSMALLRTSLTDKTLMQIYDLEFKYVWIWLDSDEAGMKGAAKVSKTLRHFLPSDVKLFTISSEKEPKQCTPRQLDEMFS
jgi:hypothetical protein